MSWLASCQQTNCTLRDPLYPPPLLPPFSVCLSNHRCSLPAGFAILVIGTFVYAHGDEVEERKARALERWRAAAGALGVRGVAHRARPPPIKSTTTMLAPIYGVMVRKRWYSLVELAERAELEAP